MKRTYAAVKLLEHGPLTMGEILDITRWPRRITEYTLQELRAMGVVVIQPTNRPGWWRYALREGQRA